VAAELGIGVDEAKLEDTGEAATNPSSSTPMPRTRRVVTRAEPRRTASIATWRLTQSPRARKGKRLEP